MGLRCAFLLLLLILRLGEIDGNVGNRIPCIVDAGEQEQKHDRSDAVQCWHRIAQKKNRRDEEY
jgi:hypothetical protein